MLKSPDVLALQADAGLEGAPFGQEDFFFDANALEIEWGACHGVPICSPRTWTRRCDDIVRVHRTAKVTKVRWPLCFPFKVSNFQVVALEFFHKFSVVIACLISAGKLIVARFIVIIFIIIIIIIMVEFERGRYGESWRCFSFR